ncbi:MAG: tetratricopeptide repeat protein [Hyphomicrobiaceae bacterium]
MRALLVILLLCVLPNRVHAQSADLVKAYDAYQVASKAGKLKEAIAAAETALQLGLRDYGPQHQNTVTFRVNLAALYVRAQKFTEAEKLYREAVSALTPLVGEKSIQLVDVLLDLGTAQIRTGRLSDAKISVGRALSIAEEGFGPNHPKTGTALNNLGEVLRHQGKLSESIPLYQRSLAIAERPGSKTKPASIALRRGNYALILKQLGRFVEAEEQYRKALVAMETAYGPDHPNVAITLDNLGNLYLAQSRYKDAEKFYLRAQATFQKIYGPNHTSTATSLNNLGALYWETRRYPEAASHYKRALDVSEKIHGPKHPSTALVLDNLAGAYQRMKKNADALALRQRALAIFEEAFGDAHPRTSTTLSNLAELYEDVNRSEDAEILYRRSIKVNDSVFGPDHPSTSLGYGNLASLKMKQRLYGDAIEHGQKGIDALIRHTNRVALAGGSAEGMLKRRRWMFHNHVRSAYWLAQKNRAAGPALMDRAFIAAQWSAHSAAAAALAQMSTRFGAGDGALAQLVRESQDLSEQRQKIDKAILAAVSRGVPVTDAGLVAKRAELAGVDERLGGITRQFETRFPEYASLANPQPLTISETQKLIGPGETLAFYLHVPLAARGRDSVFIWVLTRDEARWFRGEFEGERLGDVIAALRCGLDAAAWHGTGEQRCNGLLNTTFTQASAASGTLLPFNLKLAHKLHAALLKPFEAATEGRELMVVATGPLTQLPFQVLVTDPPANDFAEPDELKDVAWLGRSAAVSVLPSVNSLKALRAFAKDSQATKPFAGFGNPLLTGRNGDDRSAWAKQKCPGTRDLGRRISDRLAALPGIGSFFRGAIADVARLRRQVPLPDTADEICAVADELAVREDDIWLGERLNENAIKTASADRQLLSYKVLHFATHGLIAGDLKGLAEPALLLTPPDKPTERNDGLLTASEVAQLKTDADWVVMSACNTAAGDAEGAEALSGLARAFFYSGSRALLVSHWAVYSSAAVELTTGTFTALQSDRTISRAEAFRRAMARVIDSGADYKAHPAYWAPFVIVGEGGRTN